MTYVCAEAQEHAVAEVTRMSGRPAAGPRLSIVPANKIRRYHVTNPARTTDAPCRRTALHVGGEPDPTGQHCAVDR